MTVPKDLEGVVADFERLGQELFADGVWTCHGGAVFLKFLLDRASIPAELCVGLYWWDEEDLEELQALLGRSEDEDWLDEHHHWAVAHLNEGSYLIDPNGELRGQPRVQPLSSARRRYRPDDGEGQWSGVYSDSDPKEVAEWDRDVARAIALVEAASPHGPELVIPS